MLEDVKTNCPQCRTPLVIRWEDSGKSFACPDCAIILLIEEDSFWNGDSDVPMLYVKRPDGEP